MRLVANSPLKLFLAQCLLPADGGHSVQYASASQCQWRGRDGVFPRLSSSPPSSAPVFSDGWHAPDNAQSTGRQPPTPPPRSNFPPPTVANGGRDGGVRWTRRRVGCGGGERGGGVPMQEYLGGPDSGGGGPARHSRRGDLHPRSHRRGSPVGPRTDTAAAAARHGKRPQGAGRGRAASVRRGGDTARAGPVGVAAVGQPSPPLRDGGRAVARPAAALHVAIIGAARVRRVASRVPLSRSAVSPSSKVLHLGPPRSAARPAVAASRPPLEVRRPVRCRYVVARPRPPSASACRSPHKPSASPPAKRFGMVSADAAAAATAAATTGYVSAMTGKLHATLIGSTTCSSRSVPRALSAAGCTMAAALLAWRESGYEWGRCKERGCLRQHA